MCPAQSLNAATANLNVSIASEVSDERILDRAADVCVGVALDDKPWHIALRLAISLPVRGARTAQDAVRPGQREYICFGFQRLQATSFSRTGRAPNVGRAAAKSHRSGRHSMLQWLIRDVLPRERSTDVGGRSFL